MHNGRALSSSEARAGPKGRYNRTRIGRCVPQSDSHTVANSTLVLSPTSDAARIQRGRDAQQEARVLTSPYASPRSHSCCL